MKKAFAIFLSLTYLAMVSGLAVNVHYCMGKLASVAIGHPEGDRCPDCGMENAGCCKDQVVVMKVEDSHAKPTISYQVGKVVPTPPSHPAADIVRRLSVQETGSPFHLEPGEQCTGRSICIRHRTFRI